MSEGSDQSFTLDWISEQSQYNDSHDAFRRSSAGLIEQGVHIRVVAGD
jgi:hypothetical protein